MGASKGYLSRGLMVPKGISSGIANIRPVYVVILLGIIIIVMSWTSHDQFFGWLHCFKLNRNNYVLGGKNGINERPYPIILNNPSFQEVLYNWNFADTGLLLTFVAAGLFIARRIAVKDHLVEGIIERRTTFKAYHRGFVALGLFLALRNSAYRLQGYVPNGLPKQPAELVKYDFSSELIDSTFWRYVF